MEKCPSLVQTTQAPENKVLEVAYQATVLHGRLAYNEANTTFAVILPRNMSALSKAPEEGGAVTVVERELRLTNEFAVPLLLVTAVVDDGDFEVVSFPSDRALHPREPAPPLTVRWLGA